MTFKAPSTLPGLEPEAERALGKVLNQLETTLGELGAGQLVTPLKTSDYTADLFEFVRTTPPNTGARVLLPIATKQNAGKWVLIGIESVASGGTVTILVVGGSQKVNNAASVAITVAGLVLAYSTSAGWVCTLLSSGGGGLTPIADDSLLANVSGAPAVPVGTTFVSLAGTGLTWNAALNRFDVSFAPAVTSTDVTITLPFAMKQFDTVAVVDANITALSKITVGWGTPNPNDENNPEDDATFFTAAAAAGSMTVRVYKPAPSSFIGGTYKIRYIIGV